MTDSIDSELRLQKRFLTPLLSKKVPPIPPEEGRKKSPDRNANLLSIIFFSWFVPIMKVGYKRTLHPNDLFALEDQDKVEFMAEKFLANFNHYVAAAEKKYLIQRAKDKEMSRQNKLKNMTQEEVEAEEKSQSSDEDEDDLIDFQVPKAVIFKSIFMTFKRRYFFACICVATANLAQNFAPLLTKKLIEFVELKALGLPTKIGDGVGYAIGCVVLVYFSGICLNHGFYKGMFVGAQVRAVLIRSILQKSFKLSSVAKHDFPSSKITSMMGTDASRIDFALGFQPFLITFLAPLITIIVILIINIGVSALVGIAMLFVYIFIMGGFSKFLFALRGQATKYTDLRVNYIKEVLNNLKIIKFYSWEDAYFKNIRDVRQKEMNIINKMQFYRNITVAGAINLSLVASLVAFLVLYGIGSGKRTPANIFSSISLFNNFTSLVFMLPMAISSLSDAMVGVQRIGDFLNAREVLANEGLMEVDEEVKSQMKAENLAIKVNNASFEWEIFEQDPEEAKMEKMTDDEKKDYEKEVKKEAKKKAKEIKKSKKNGTYIEAERKQRKIRKDIDLESAFPGLNNIDFNIKKGEFVVITGLIGSGKSSLLNAVAGFMKRIGGTVDVNGSLILCGQPWIQNSSVKENILFGSELDDEKYEKVIYSCSLESDLEILPAGDRTEIGERGITLSGGQKARINLARAVYSDRDIILLDDVLSAVDARVGKHIMEECLLGLLKDRTRILATHQLSLIGAADKVIFLNGDSSVSVGTLEELQHSNEGFKKLMTFSTEKEKEQEEEQEVVPVPVEDEEKEMINRQLTRRSTKVSIVDKIDEEAIHRDYNLDEDVTGKLGDDEHQAVNGVSPKVYWTYFKLGSGFFKYNTQFIALAFFMVFGTFAYLFTNTWLSFWTEYKFKNRSNGFYIGIYVMFTILSFILTSGLLTSVGYVNNRASTKLNILAIEKVLHTPMSFMDVTPMGRILNRFTKDTDVLDNELSDQMRFLAFMVTNICGIIILCIIYLPWFALAVVPFIFIAFLFGEFYQSSAREIKRIEAIQRSFVYNNFNETLSGMDTIVAYQSEHRFLEKNDYYINRMNEAYYLVIGAQRWIGINLELIACALPLLITLLTVFRVFNINASSTGLVVSYVIAISGQVAFLVRIYTQVEVGMNSTERLFEYSYDLDQEAAYTIPENDPEPSWPQYGAIEFKDVSLAYRPGLPFVLKDLSFQVKPQEKIGICGRTGAGKSSIMTALYRLSELNQGLIQIDGVDISRLGLKTLRSKLSIIPQDPVLFRGSIRKNLDPFGQSSDEKLWDALRRAGLIEGSRLDAVIHQSGEDNLHKFHLNQEVEDEGTNFSLGERQLISLARALVRDSKILILDEATSSVDYETDAKIQQTIVNEFGDCTILCIAHRLKTIVNYDRILVLHRGEIKEFDTPWNLFNLEDGIFQQMCQRSKIVEGDFERKD